MLPGYGRVTQAFFGTIFTWALTALGAAGVFVLPRSNPATDKKVLDVCLGFAAGVMVAASFWSLLNPAIEYAQESKTYGAQGEWAFVPVVAGFMLGGLFVFLADKYLDNYGSVMYMLQGDNTATTTNNTSSSSSSVPEDGAPSPVGPSPVASPTTSPLSSPRRTVRTVTTVRKRIVVAKDGREMSTVSTKTTNVSANGAVTTVTRTLPEDKQQELLRNKTWKRMLLLVLAITIHNFPEGLAVGVGFGSVDEKSDKFTFAAAVKLAWGIGLQNFPEGLAVSLPLLRVGCSPWKSFFYGQLSGMVEPVGGVLGAYLIHLAQPCLPYALSFAAGAMIFVVFDDIIPEVHQTNFPGDAGVVGVHGSDNEVMHVGHASLASWGAMLGFAVMMAMDVAL